MSDRASSPPTKLAPFPSGGVRALISYLLFLHFFFLAVGIKSNNTSSGLDQDLRKKVPGLTAYLQLGVMDLSYMFQLTHYDWFNNIQDTDYFVEADVPEDPDGSVKTGKTMLVVFGAKSPHLPVRDHRYDRAAYHSTLYAATGNDSLGSLMPQAYARRILLEQGRRDLNLRIRRWRRLQNPLLLENHPEAKSERSQPFNDPSRLETVYEAYAFMGQDGVVNVSQNKAAFETAAPQGTPAQPPRAQPTATAAPSGSAIPTGLLTPPAPLTFPSLPGTLPGGTRP